MSSLFLRRAMRESTYPYLALIVSTDSPKCSYILEHSFWSLDSYSEFSYPFLVRSVFTYSSSY